LFDISVKKEKLFFLAIIIVSGLALYLTFSYATWLALIIWVLFWLFFRGIGATRKKKTAIIYGLLFLAAIAILFVSQLNSEKLDNFLHSGRSSWQSRLMIWRAAWAMAKDHPIFGIGPGMFQDYYLKYQNRFVIPYLEWAVPQPHNLFLAFWLETGLLGLVGFIWLLIIFFKKIYASARSNYLALILAMMMGYTLTHGLIDTTYFKNDLAVVFWVIIAFAVVLSGVKKTQTD
jgi:putative inorganic carbon (hco3(-)) transporter